MKRRAAALMCAALLVCQLISPPAAAAETVYFMAAEVEVLPLSASTMPFWSGGYLYIPSTMFSGSVRKSLDITCYTSSAGQTVILHNANGRLVYERGKNYAKDPDSGTYYPGMVERNGVAFVPASQVAGYFGLLYSVIDVDRGHLVWLRKPGFGLSDKDFANAATSNMVDRYNAYVQGSQAAQPQEDEENPASDGDGALQQSAGKRVYLCLEAGKNTAAQLDALDAYDAQAAFFCTPEFLEGQGDLLRRMTATGQAIGILVNEQDGRTVEEQLETGNRALARATCGKTRLAYVQSRDERTAQAVQSAGFFCLTPDLDRSGYELKSTSNAKALLNRITVRRGDVTIWLGDTADSGGLRAFLLAAKKADDSCMALTETA